METHISKESPHIIPRRRFLKATGGTIITVLANACGIPPKGDTPLPILASRNERVSNNPVDQLLNVIITRSQRDQAETNDTDFLEVVQKIMTELYTSLSHDQKVELLDRLHHDPKFLAVLPQLKSKEIGQDVTILGVLLGSIFQDFYRQEISVEHQKQALEISLRAYSEKSILFETLNKDEASVYFRDISFLYCVFQPEYLEAYIRGKGIDGIESYIGQQIGLQELLLTKGNEGEIFTQPNIGANKYILYTYRTISSGKQDFNLQGIYVDDLLPDEYLYRLDVFLQTLLEDPTGSLKVSENKTVTLEEIANRNRTPDSPNQQDESLSFMSSQGYFKEGGRLMAITKKVERIQARLAESKK